MAVKAGRTKAGPDSTTEEIEALFNVNAGNCYLKLVAANRNESASYGILHGGMSCWGIHQAWYQGGDHVYGLHGLLPPKQGSFSCSSLAPFGTNILILLTYID